MMRVLSAAGLFALVCALAVVLAAFLEELRDIGRGGKW
jgi:hypothetical protein